MPMNIIIIFSSYEYVFLQAEAIKRMGGNGPAQVKAIADDVIN